MAPVQIDNLVPGMVLKNNVTDRSGRMLLPKGATLESRHFGIFRMWGVLEVEVTYEADAEVPAAPQGEEIDAERLRKATEELGRIFAHNDSEHPAIRELMRICVKRRALHEA